MPLLNYDVLHLVLEEVEPADLFSCAATCRDMRSVIIGNTALFKKVYLKNWDDPRLNADYKGWDWITGVKQLLQCERLIRDIDGFPASETILFVAKTVAFLVSTASYSKGGSEADSRNKAYLRRVFGILYFSKLPKNIAPVCFGELDWRALWPPRGCYSTECWQAIAKMSMLSNEIDRGDLATARGWIYDLRRYTDRSNWGPFNRDGSLHVDWELLEQVWKSISLRETKPGWGDNIHNGIRIFEGLATEKRQIGAPSPVDAVRETKMPTELTIPLQWKDPYDVTGLYKRLLWFLERDDLFNFNVNHRNIPLNAPRGPLHAQDNELHIWARLEVTDVTPACPPLGLTLPVVHFKGESVPENDQSIVAQVKGQVRLNPEGEVWWTTTTSTGETERNQWTSESIQVGGPRSKRGGLGMWLGAARRNRDVFAQCGPIVFWKADDDSQFGGPFAR